MSRLDLRSHPPGPTDEVRLYKEEASEAAIQLGYGPSVVNRIEASMSVTEIARVMKTAREEGKLIFPKQPRK